MIKIKQMELEDVEFFNETRNLSKEMLHNNEAYSLEESKSWFAEQNPMFYVIYYNSDKIGYFRTSNFSKKNKNIYIGADLHPDFRGKGFAFLAYKKFIDYLFETLDLNKISLEVLSINKIAYNLYKKLGFIEEGIKRQEIKRENEYIDSIIMSILKKEWGNE